MSAEADVDNITLGTGGSSITVYTESVEEIYTKILILIKPPQATGNFDAGPKTTKVVDLLRIEHRFSVRGFIDAADVAALKAFMTGGGVFNLTWDSDSQDVNMDKLTIDKASKKGVQAERPVTFTAVVGEDI